YQENDRGLSIFFSHDDAVTPILKQWLKQRANVTLPLMLFTIAHEMGETYQSVSIRLQTTRWGSCSNQRRINLNAKLLLLPETFPRYIMVHELAHLQHLNHSKSFWQRVAQFEPHYLAKKKGIHAWWKQQPRWLL
ncbi:MAG: M48 family metallopeptidase, partial [Mariprofundaceae bacterium]|nr:M48 family metallopeptidase [Mariprofundaceae bacterium]